MAVKDAKPAKLDSVAQAEKTKYEKVWQIDQYREVSPSFRELERFIRACQPEVNQTVIDYGAGTGRADLALRERGLKVTMVDIAENALDEAVRDALLPGFLEFVPGCLWDLPGSLAPSDYFYCCDVMEHIPPEKVEAVLENIAAKTLCGGFFGIALFEDHYFAGKVGEHLHLTVETADWWVDKLQKYWVVVPQEITSMHLFVTVTNKPA